MKQMGQFWQVNLIQQNNCLLWNLVLNVLNFQVT